MEKVRLTSTNIASCCHHFEMNPYYKVDKDNLVRFLKLGIYFWLLIDGRIAQLWWVSIHGNLVVAFMIFGAPG